MVYDKIKYVFRKDGQSGKKWIDNCLKFYKDNPDSPALVNVASRYNIKIVSINDIGSYIKYSDAHNDESSHSTLHSYYRQRLLLRCSLS